MRAKSLLSYSLALFPLIFAAVARADVRVLAIGDSLTDGLCPSEFEKHPYSQRLLERLHDEQATDEWVVETQGESGELTRDMVKRLSHLLEAAKKKGKSYDYILILGGTNDLGRRVEAQKVYDNLKAMYKLAYKFGSLPIAITIPEVRYDDPNGRHALDHAKRRAMVNQGIKGLSAIAKFPVVDLDANRHEIAADKYWEEDGLHFTPSGYDKLGDLIYDVLHATHESRRAISDAS